tara:strand:+ start:207 stop:452 length:246 start_codon:yes stop_codon:yes gene_type:complete
MTPVEKRRIQSMESYEEVLSAAKAMKKARVDGFETPNYKEGGDNEDSVSASNSEEKEEDDEVNNDDVSETVSVLILNHITL